MCNHCLKCEKEIPTSKKFCNSSCAAKYNNSRRKHSPETKQKIAETLTKKFDVEAMCIDYQNGMIIDELCAKYNIGKSTAQKNLHNNGLKHIKYDETTYCEKHEQFFVLRKDETYHCSQCHTEAKQTRRQKLKIKSVEYLGGECKFCGYKKSLCALDFHHLDPLEKDFQLSSMGSKKWETIKIELDKCILLCVNCHREEHERLRNLK